MMPCFDMPTDMEDLPNSVQVNFLPKEFFLWFPLKDTNCESETLLG